jgi:hypothetical protein
LINLIDIGITEYFCFAPPCRAAFLPGWRRFEPSGGWESAAVVMGEMGIDGGDRVADADEGNTANDLVGEPAKKSFGQVAPR